MKIVVINATEIRGCTYNIKEAFLSVLKTGNEIREYYLPKDMPHFCQGCKICFFEDESLCPHSEHTMPIWNSIIEADLLIFATPVYAMRIPGQLKALLDHFACHWMVHRPEKAMFTKRAVILTNSIGAPNRPTQKDIVISLNWLGVSKVKSLGFGLMEDVIWDNISQKRRNIIQNKTENFASKYIDYKPGSKGLKIKVYFFISKMIQKGIIKKSEVLSADNKHWISNGWIKCKGK